MPGDEADIGGSIRKKRRSFCADCGSKVQQLDCQSLASSSSRVGPADS